MSTEEETDFELFKVYVSDLLASRGATSNELDKAILTLSGAGLGLSLTFIKDIVPLAQLQVIALLYASWCLFILAIITTLVTYMLARPAFDLQIKKTENCFLLGETDAYDKRNPFKTAVEAANVAATLFLLGALTTTAVFTSVNISSARKARLSDASSISVAPATKHVPECASQTPKAK